MADSDKQGTEVSQTESSVAESNQKGVQPTNTVTVEQLNQILDAKFETFRRSAQSEKDKGIKKVGERVEQLEGDLRSVLQSAAKEGKSVSDVLSDIEAQEERESRRVLLEMAKAFQSGNFPLPSSGGTEQKQGVNVDAVVKDLELDENDIRVKAFKSQSFSSEAEAIKAAAKLQKSILTTQPSDADLPADVANRAKNASNQEKLMQEYKEGSKSLFGMQLVNYKQVMRKKGLNIQ
jgi:hypothetical protein